MIAFELFTSFGTLLLQRLLRNYHETHMKRQINLTKFG